VTTKHPSGHHKPEAAEKEHKEAKPLLCEAEDEENGPGEFNVASSFYELYKAQHGLDSVFEPSEDLTIYAAAPVA
jgi:hypothetical protein